jgi:hypothetical protein
MESADLCWEMPPHGRRRPIGCDFLGVCTAILLASRAICCQPDTVLAVTQELLGEFSSAQSELAELSHGPDPPRSLPNAGLVG